MAPLWALLTVSCSLTIHATFSDYTVMDKFVNKCVRHAAVTDHVLFKNNSTRSVLDCAQQCNRDGACLAFTFARPLCQGYIEVTTSDSQRSTMHGAVTFVRREADTTVRCQSPNGEQVLMVPRHGPLTVVCQDNWMVRLSVRTTGWCFCGAMTAVLTSTETGSPTRMASATSWGSSGWVWRRCTTSPTRPATDCTWTLGTGRATAERPCTPTSSWAPSPTTTPSTCSSSTALQTTACPVWRAALSPPWTGITTVAAGRTARRRCTGPGGTRPAPRPTSVAATTTPVGPLPRTASSGRPGAPHLTPSSLPSSESGPSVEYGSIKSQSKNIRCVELTAC
ncbi:uncharacterized protein LOC143298511 isoform X1 [Babylonia areolata]|uniref:uncharacterized protein LOC143298511 isoform X1 n=1 Tax=Babylonia areolata TaxID=304850 RepID=UPI003FD4FB44